MENGIGFWKSNYKYILILWLFAFIVSLIFPSTSVSIEEKTGELVGKIIGSAMFGGGSSWELLSGRKHRGVFLNCVDMADIMEIDAF